MSWYFIKIALALATYHTNEDKLKSVYNRFHINESTAYQKQRTHRRRCMLV